MSDVWKRNGSQVYSQGLCFIPGAKVGPVRVIETFIIENFHVLLDWVWGGGGGTKH